MTVLYVPNPDLEFVGEEGGAQEGICHPGRKATWKREFKLPWREAGPPIYQNGFGPEGCQ